MTTPEYPDHPLLTPLAAAFAALIDNGVVDVVREDDDSIEIQADEWTIHLEGWPIHLAFVALDEDPDSEDEQIRALTAALGPRDLAALREADEQVEGAILDALAASRDPLSQTLSRWLRAGEI